MSEENQTNVTSEKQERKKEKGKRKKSGAKIFSRECKECEEYKAGWARAQADYRNLQKEVENMKGEWVRLSEVQILEEFIPVYDNFKKAINFTNFDTNETSSNTNWQNWRKGIEHIMTQFEKVLRDHGIEEIKTVGEIFDPNLHEAVGALEPEPDDSVQGKNLEEGRIVREVEAGYTMKDKVIKCAKVIICKK